MPITDQDLAAFHSVQLPQATAGKKKKGNLITNLLPTIGGTGGGIAGGAAGGALAGSMILPGVGTVAGGLIGALLGGASGGAVGKIAENKLEGNALGSGVGGAAIENGVLSAGPLRLLKGAATAGKAATIGKAGLADALNIGAEKAVAPSAIKTAIGSRLNATSESLAAKALGITKGQKNDILAKTGERAGAIAKKYGIVDAADVPKVVKPMYNEFSNAVTAIPRTFSKQEVGSAFKSIYDPLVAEGTPLGSQAIGNKLKEEAANLLKGVSKDGISASELNAKRQAFDKLAFKLKATDPSLADVNKQSRDVLSNLIHSAADEHGVTTSAGSLKQLGNQINKIERLGKAANRNVEGAGGHMQLGLGALPGATIGSAGGPAGAAAGYAANMALNSTGGRKATAKVLDTLSNKMTGSVAKGATQATTKAGQGLQAVGGLGGVTKRVAPIGLAGALMQDAQVSNDSPNNQQMDTSMTTPSASNIDSLSQVSDQNANAVSDTSNPFDPVNAPANIQKMLADGATMKDISEYVSLVKTISSMMPDTSATKGLNSTAAGVVADTQTGLGALGSLSQALAGSNANMPVIGNLRAKNPFDTGAQNLQAQVATAKQIVGKALEGGVLRKEDEAKYAKLLPTMGDSDAVAQFKIAQLQQLISSRLNDYKSAMAGGDGGSVVSVGQ